jgi:hypothetical protein
MVGKMLPKDSKLALIIEHVSTRRSGTNSRSHISKFLWDLNSEVDSYANKASTLNQGVLVKKWGETIASSPKVV